MARLTMSIAVAVLTIAARAAHADELVVLQSRPGVTQTFLVQEPEAGVKGSVILFPSEEGIVQFRKGSDDRYEVSAVAGGLTGHDAIRARLRESGFAVAVIAPPSDRSALSPAFRKSAEHADDVHAVMDYLHKRFGTDPYLAGHCLSSLSVASVASRLKSAGISGLIMASTRSSGPAGAVTDFEPGAVTVPVLLVQHNEDSCPHTSPRYLHHVRSFFESSAAKVDVIAVTGGNVHMKRGMQSCKDGLHGFAGVRQQTSEAIADWLSGARFPTLVQAGAR